MRFLYVLTALLLSFVFGAEAQSNAPASSPVVVTDSAEHAPAEVDKAFTSGLGLGTGIGKDNVSFGAHAVYYHQLRKPWLHLAFHLGGGAILGTYRARGVVGGTFLSIGRHHRLTVGVHGGLQSSATSVLYGVAWETRGLYGAGATIGYELVTPAGFYLRINVGPAFHVWPETPLSQRSVQWEVAGNLISLGYKIW